MTRLGTLVLIAVGALSTQVAAQTPILLDATTVRGSGAYDSPPVPAVRGEAPAITAANVGAFFDAAFDLQRLDHPMVGAVVSVVYGDEVLFQRGYGWADLEKRIPADPERSLYRIASISKTFVWTALMQLVEQGRIDLDGEVNQYLDFEIPSTYAEPVRVWHLLTHTAGFEESWTGWGARDASEVRDLGVALAGLLPGRVRPPGEHASYSNYGAALAGYIVQRVSGRHWSEYIDDEVLEPLGMTSTNTHTVMASELRDRHARGYVLSNGVFAATEFQHIQLEPAGNMSSTAADMALFMLAHLNLGEATGQRILEESTARRMQSPLFSPHEGLPPILHGFYRSDRNGETVFGHGGDINQFHSNMSMLPEHGLGVFVSYNSDPAAVARGNVGLAFLDHFFPAEHLRRTPNPPEVDLSDYEGQYLPLRNPVTTFERLRTLAGPGAVSVEGEELRLGQGPLWTPVGQDRFTGHYEDVLMVFERDEDGDVTHMLVGSPLGTLERVRGLRAPGVVMPMLQASLFVLLAAVLGWGYRVARPVSEALRLPSPHVRVAWVLAFVQGGLLLWILQSYGTTLFGIPTSFHLKLLGLNVALVLGLVLVGFSVRQWMGGHGTIGSRARYSLVALAALFNLWFAWSYHLLGYWI